MKKLIALFLAVFVLFSMAPYTSVQAASHQGITKISGKYFLYNENGRLLKKNVTIKGVRYFIDSKKHNIRARKYKRSYYYANGRKMTKADKKDFTTLLRAEKIVKRITRKKSGKYTKLKKCFRWVMKFPYKTRRRFIRTKDWPSVYANDHFVRHGGNCHADAAAFAYLAAACGYKRVYVCSDTSKSSESSHSWTEVRGRAFDPLFAQAKNYSRNWNSRYGVYELSPAIKVRIPYGRPSHNKHGKMIPKKTLPQAEKSSSDAAKKIVKWSSKKKHLYYNDGTIVKGTAVWKEKFYAFTKKGVYRESFTTKLRDAAKEGKSISVLKKLIGEPEKISDNGFSCYGGERDGRDRSWKYKQFTVFTFKPDDGGSELFISVE